MSPLVFTVTLNGMYIFPIKSWLWLHNVEIQSTHNTEPYVPQNTQRYTDFSLSLPSTVWCFFKRPLPKPRRTPRRKGRPWEAWDVYREKQPWSTMAEFCGDSWWTYNNVIWYKIIFTTSWMKYNTIWYDITWYITIESFLWWILSDYFTPFFPLPHGSQAEEKKAAAKAAAKAKSKARDTPRGCINYWSDLFMK